MNVRWQETINVDDLWEGDMTAVTVTARPCCWSTSTGPLRHLQPGALTRHRPWTRAIWTVRR